AKTTQNPPKVTQNQELLARPPARSHLQGNLGKPGLGKRELGADLISSLEMFVTPLRPSLEFHCFSSSFSYNAVLNHSCTTRSLSNYPLPNLVQRVNCFASKAQSDPQPNSKSSDGLETNPIKPKTRLQKTEVPAVELPTTIPKKPKRGRKSEASAVEDFVRGSLERTFASIKEKNPEILKEKEKFIKDKIDEESDPDRSDLYDDDGVDDQVEKEMVVEEESPDWPLDADVGWGIRASEYFDQHAIKNVKGEDGEEIDWEGEIDDNWVKEIDCLAWERFAFHPSPLVVLVFERYNRASKNWKVLKELEKAVQVYLGAKHLLPPRAVYF
ncbi:hypothetical protein Leryth_026293, partial [Lithospermum erythrorhizon]